MIRYTLAVVVAVVWLTSEAAAIECAAEAQSRTAYWSWRIIDGKRCWYPGRPGMSKANLHWRTATVGQRGPAEPNSALAAAVEWDTDVVQRNAADNAQPERQLTFRERWPY
jgi:hypothetical protein